METFVNSTSLLLLEPSTLLSVVLSIAVTLYGLGGLGSFYAYIPQVKVENDTMTKMNLGQYICWLIGLILLFVYTIVIAQALWLSVLLIVELVVMVTLFCLLLCRKYLYVKELSKKLACNKKNWF